MPRNYDYDDSGHLVPKGYMERKKKFEDLKSGLKTAEKTAEYASYGVTAAVLGGLGYGAYKLFGGGKKKPEKSKKVLGKAR